MNFLADLSIKTFFDNSVTRFLFGVGDAEFSDKAELIFLNMLPAWLLLLILLPALSLVILLYCKESRNAGRVSKGIMATMRILVLLLVLLVFMEPTIKSVKSEERLPTIVIAIDTSSSMNIIDEQLSDEQAKQLAAQIGTTADQVLKSLSRLDLVKQALTHKDFLARLKSMGVVKLVRFDGKIHYEEDGEDGEKDSGALDQRIKNLAADGTDTNIAKSLSEIMEATRSDYKVAAIIVISDGRDTVDAAQALKDRQDIEKTLRAPGSDLKIFTIMVGDTTPPKDIIARGVKGPSRVSVESPIRLDLWFTQIGFKEGEVEYEIRATNIDTKQTKVVVNIKDKKTRFKFGLTDFLKEGEISKEIKETKIVMPEGTGKWLYNIKILKAPEGEIDLTNNRTNPGLLITVTDRLLKVLIVEGAPRWEYRTLKSVLLRANKEFQVQCMLLDADPNFPQEHTLFPDDPRFKKLQDETPSLDKFPDAEALDKYDVIIWGDVNPNTRRMHFGSQQMKNVAKWVLEGHASPSNAPATGGGIICMFGKQYFPHEYGSSAREAGATELGKVLPCGIEALDDKIASSETPIPYKLARAGLDNEVLRMYSNRDKNKKLWETGLNKDTSQYYLPGSYWFWPIKNPNKSALVLLRHGTKNGSDKQGYPLILYQQKGPRAVFAMAIEDTYLWRGVRDELYSMFWIRLVKTAAKGGVTQGRYSIITDRPDYNKGPKVVVKVSATMLDDKIKSQKKIKAYYKMLVVSQDTKDEPEPQEVMITLEADTSAGNEGKFIGEIMTESLAPGYYTLWLDKTILANVEETVSTQFTIREVEPENLDRTAKSALLDIIAKITIPKPAGAKDADRKTQGFSLSRSLSDIYAIPDNFVAEKVHVRVATAHIPIWASWLTLLLALVLLSIEWIIRKLRRLI